MLNITSYNLVIRCLLYNTAKAKESPATPLACLQQTKWTVARAYIGTESGYRVSTGVGFKTISGFLNETCQPSFSALDSIVQKGYRKHLKTIRKH